MGVHAKAPGPAALGHVPEALRSKGYRSAGDDEVGHERMGGAQARAPACCPPTDIAEPIDVRRQACPKNRIFCRLLPRLSALPPQSVCVSGSRGAAVDFAPSLNRP